jgi:hypothetical protein
MQNNYFKMQVADCIIKIQVLCKGEYSKHTLMMGGRDSLFELWFPLYFIYCGRIYWLLDKIKQYYGSSNSY